MSDSRYKSLGVLIVILAFLVGYLLWIGLDRYVRNERHKRQVRQLQEDILYSQWIKSYNTGKFEEDPIACLQLVDDARRVIEFQHDSLRQKGEVTE